MNIKHINSNIPDMINLGRDLINGIREDNSLRLPTLLLIDSSISLIYTSEI